jgi:hypothetical protein
MRRCRCVAQSARLSSTFTGFRLALEVILLAVHYLVCEIAGRACAARCAATSSNPTNLFQVDENRVGRTAWSQECLTRRS